MISGQRFLNREHAGAELARLLTIYAKKPNVIVLALPRGGVPVGFQVARSLGVKLDIFTVRKLGVPEHPELAMGAIASGGVRVLNSEIIDRLQIGEDVLERVAELELQELERREKEYRGARKVLNVRDKIVILVDDGLATGASMRAAARALKQQAPSRIVVSAPIGARETCDSLSCEVDEVACAITPKKFRAVGAWYDDFTQTTDEEVRQYLTENERERKFLAQ